MDCLVCRASLNQPVLRSEGQFSISSLARPAARKIEVYWCHECAHLQTPPMVNIEAYYDTDYNILTGSEDEDQLYGIFNGKRVFRAEHQFNTLLRKIDLPNRARVLDYGCGKAAVCKLLKAARPDISSYLFDVTDAYRPFWAKFVRPENWALHQPPAHWRNKMDVVFSFFALEHAPEPRRFVVEAAGMLRRGGLFYCVIPNPFGSNACDILVNDHINHFSKPSLQRLLGEAGLEITSIDDEVHDLAYVVVAKRTRQTSPRIDKEVVMAVGEQVRRLANLWAKASERIRAFERQHPGPCAIYGAGFCGCYIGLALEDSSRLLCFIDQNPYKQGTQLLGKPVVSLEAFGKISNVIYVGLNPDRARSAMQQIEAWKDRLNHYFFL